MAEQLNLGDLTWKLGFDSEEQFLQALNQLFDKAESKAKSGGSVGGEEFGKEFTDKAKQSASGFGDDFIRSLGIQTLGTFLGQALQNAFQSAISATQQFVGESVDSFRRYEAGMVQLKIAGETNLGAIAEQYKAISEQSKIFSVGDISAAMGQLIQSGLDAKTAMGVLKSSVNAAAYSLDPVTGKFANLGDVVTQISQVMRALNLDFSRTSEISDILALAAQKSGTDIRGLVGAVANVGAVSSVTGISVTELGATIAYLTNQGRSADEAATGLRTVIQGLLAPTGKLKGQADELGISFVTSTGQTRPFLEVIKNLGTIAEQGGRGAQFLKEVGLDTYALNTAIAIAKGADQIKAFDAELQSAGGSAQKYADITRDSLAGSLEEMRAKTENAKIALGRELVPIMQTFYTSIAPEMVTALGNITENIRLMLEALGKGKVDVDKFFKSYDIVNATAEQRDKFQKILQERQKVEAQIGEIQNAAMTDDPLSRALSTLGNPVGLNVLDGKIAQLKARREELIKQGVELQREIQTAYGAGLSFPSPPNAPTDTSKTTPKSAAPVDNELYQKAFALQRELRAAEADFAKSRSKASADRIDQLKTEIKTQELANEKFKTYSTLAAQALRDDAKPAKRARLSDDPIIKEAQDLDKSLRLLETRFGLGQVPLEQYQGQLSKLESRFQALGKSARSTDQQLAVATGLKAVQAAQEKQDKLDQEARARAAQSDVDRAKWVAAQKAETYKLAYEAEKQYQDELDKQKAQAVQTDFERARDVATAQAASFQKALGEKAKLVDTTNDLEGLESLKAFYEKLGLTGEAAYQRILTKLDELYTFQKQFGAESAKNRDANILASDKILQQQLFDARQVVTNFAENPKLFAQTDFDKTSQAIDLLELYGQDVSHLRELLGQATTEFVQLGDAASGVFSDQAPVQDYISNFDKLVLQLKTGKTVGEDFRTQAEAIIAQLDKYAAAAASKGDFTLFDAANKAADALFARLNEIIGLNKNVIKGPDNTVLGKLPDDLKTAGDDVGELEGKVNSLLVALNNAPTDPLELEAFATEVNTQMFALFDELEAKLATLPPDDAAVARLQQTLDLLRQIALVGTGAFGGTILGDGTVVPEIKAADNFSKGAAEFRAGEREGTVPTITPPPATDFSKAADQLGSRMTSIAGTFIKDLVGGTTDVGGALKKALGDASSFFLDQMIQGIIGPIAQELGKAVAGSLFEKGASGALSLGPLGLILGGGLLLGSLLLGGNKQSASQQAARSSSTSVGGATSINYTTELNFNVPYVGSLAEPNFRAQLREFVLQMLDDYERRKRPPETA
ncbi:MAG: phage tail tape measure protein [Thermaceae bacterium]|nr:phage tail tape measure protein [Thermaceae bacterium]